MKNFRVLAALAGLSLLAACSATSDSGASGVAGRSDVGVSSSGNGSAYGSSVYQNELRAENSN